MFLHVSSVRHLRDFVLHIEFSDDTAVAGVVLSDQVKSLDWRARRAEPIASLPSRVTEEVLQKLGTLVG